MILCNTTMDKRKELPETTTDEDNLPIIKRSRKHAASEEIKDNTTITLTKKTCIVHPFNYKYPKRARCIDVGEENQPQVAQREIEIKTLRQREQEKRRIIRERIEESDLYRQRNLTCGPEDLEFLEK